MATKHLLALAWIGLAAACAGTGAPTGSDADASVDATADTTTPDVPAPSEAEGTDTLTPDSAELTPDVPSDPGIPDPPAPSEVEGSDVAGDVATDKDAPAPSDVEGPDDWPLQYGTPCPLDQRVGLFEVGVDTYGLAAVTGTVADRVNPLQVLEVQQAEGPCVLLERPNPFCDPPCPGSQQCAPGNQCVPFPVNQGVATVTITGLSVPVSLQPDGQKTYTKTDFEGTPFAPGAHIELTAAGTVTTSGFTLHGQGFPLLDLPTTNWPFHAGDPVPIAWTPGNGVGTVRLNLNVDQHGVTPVTLVCDVPDTGSYTVPGTLTAALWSFGASGAPSSSIMRRTVDSALIENGCVEFVVSHRVKTLLKVQ